VKYSGYFGIGPEWKYTTLKWHLGFGFRYEQQPASSSSFACVAR
jgi:hypothetical protein